MVGVVALVVSDEQVVVGDPVDFELRGMVSDLGHDGRVALALLLQLGPEPPGGLDLDDDQPLLERFPQQSQFVLEAHVDDRHVAEGGRPLGQDP